MAHAHPKVFHTNYPAVVMRNDPALNVSCSCEKPCLVRSINKITLVYQIGNMSTPARPAKPYLSNGQVLQASVLPSAGGSTELTIIDDFNRPPFTARVRNFANDTYNFLGLYVTTLFSVCAMLISEQSLHCADGK